jgi:predicted nucleotide-binding protein
MASRRAPPPKPERPHHTVHEKLADIEALERRIKELEAFDPELINKRFTDPRVESLQTAIDETLSEVFGKGADDYIRYAAAATLDNGPLRMATDWSPHSNEVVEARTYAAEGKERSLSLLRRAVTRLNEEIERGQRSSVTVTLSSAVPAAPAAAVEPSRRIFIVHGHDQEMREAVARVVHQLGLEPVILHEQVNQGRTLIEKFEDHSETAQFAIVLLSPDDEGGLLNDRVSPPLPRARQNVILELGYFTGRLGRKRVCALMRGEVELPSDVLGVVYQTFDESGAWRFKLALELRAAGYAVDLNRL